MTAKPSERTDKAQKMTPELDNMRLRDSLAATQKALAAEQDARKAAEQAADGMRKALEQVREYCESRRNSPTAAIYMRAIADMCRPQ